MDFTNKKRSYYCGQVTAANIDETIVLKGWAHSRRDHGGIIFVDLRDRTGICQVVFDPDVLVDKFATAHGLRDEYVLAIEGKVRRRPEGTINAKMHTGEIEVLVKDFEILNTARILPFKLDDYAKTSEDIRLKYRFLDLRRPEMQKKFMMRHKLYQVVRKSLSDQGFIEFTTPILTKSTPEGARDFLVPARLSPGNFFALPQSPQLFKQLLMVAGYDKYFQIATCFRDEDLRANRQPEFTQIDIEASFITPEDMFDYVENLVCNVWKECKGIDISRPFKRLPYAESMLKYGSDKPDLRYDLSITEVTDLFRDVEIKVFSNVIAKRGCIRALRLPGGATLSRKQIDDYTAFVGVYDAKGLAWFKVQENELQSPLAKFLTPEKTAEFVAAVKAEVGDIIFIVADREKVVCDALGALRQKLASDMKLYDPKAFSFAWIVDFPLFEYSERDKVYTPSHHPFTAWVSEDTPKMEEYVADPDKFKNVHPDDHPLKGVRALAYDLAVNGEEMGGGSIRIHRSDVQSLLFRAINIGEEEAQDKFGFLLNALSFGAPPHGGLAFGVDRMLMLLLGETNIREVIAFPKTQSGTDLMSEAPSQITDAQLKEVYIKVDLPPETK
ncbi:MAG: aspartate--tRNA ligase [Candidatus Sumerlaeales bacterium]|nr:aspartate--tRNA ligase [Candidatus Sumerlaeales bacterium]